MLVSPVSRSLLVGYLRVLACETSRRMTARVYLYGLPSRRDGEPERCYTAGCADQLFKTDALWTHGLTVQALRPNVLIIVRSTVALGDCLSAVSISPVSAVLLLARCWESEHRRPHTYRSTFPTRRADTGRHSRPRRPVASQTALTSRPARAPIGRRSCAACLVPPIWARRPGGGAARPNPQSGGPPRRVRDVSAPTAASKQQQPVRQTDRPTD